MIPTADQVAHAVVAASRHHDVDPVMVFRQVAANRRGGALGRSRALIYALMAIADVFGNDTMACRLLRVTTARVATTRWQIGKDALKWWDPKVLELVKATIPDPPASPPVRERAAEAPVLPAVRENAQAARNPKPAGPPARRMAPNFGTVPGMGPPRTYLDSIGEKARLRRELEAAVQNTAKLPSQN